MPYKLPENKIISFHSPLRIGLIVINLLFMYWRIEKVNRILVKSENDSSIYYERANLSVMVVDVVLNAIFILAAHIKHMKLLKISLIGNIVSVLVFTLYSLCMFCYYSYLMYAQYQVSVKWLYIKPLLEKLGVIASGGSIEILISYAMLLLCNEIKELETNNYLFRFVNAAAEAKCVMECKETNKRVDEINGEEDRFEKGTVSKEDESDVIGKTATLIDYPVNNLAETKCTIEC